MNNIAINKFAEEILHLPVANQTKVFKECIDKIKSGIGIFANADEQVMVSGYHMLVEYHNRNDIEFNRELLKSIAPFKDAIVSFLESENIDADYLRKVVQRHYEEADKQKEFNKIGGRFYFKREFLQECYDLLGKRIVNLGYLLVNVEKIEEYC